MQATIASRRAGVEEAGAGVSAAARGAAERRPAELHLGGELGRLGGDRGGGAGSANSGGATRR